MSTLYFSLFSLYIFTFGGFVLKKIFKENIDAKSITIVTVYFFQPILAFWGFTKAEIDASIFGVGFLHIGAQVITLLLLLFILRWKMHSQEEQSIYVFTGTNGNTGNMGIPLSGAMFGPLGIVAATMINFSNILWNMTAGVYFYAQGNFSPKESFSKIFTMPLLWVSIIAVVLNYIGWAPSERVSNFLEHGAHTSISIQLFLLGVFFGTLRISEFSWITNIWINIVKFFLFPAIGIALFTVFFQENIQTPEVMGAALLQFFMPLAVNNANLATLYDCLPNRVAQGVVTTSLLFFCILPLLAFVLSQYGL